MAKKKAAAPADPVEDALIKTLALYDGLTKKEQEEWEARLWDTEGMFHGLKFDIFMLRVEATAAIKGAKAKANRHSKAQKHDRAIVTMKDVDGKSYAIIAEDLTRLTGDQWTDGQVEKRYKRAKRDRGVTAKPKRPARPKGPKADS